MTNNHVGDLSGYTGNLILVVGIVLGIFFLATCSVSAGWCRGFFKILDNSEKFGGPPRPNRQMQNFRNALLECDLHDIGFTGDPYTWSNRQLYPHTVVERLDRACANMSWSQLYPEVSLSHLQQICLDHKALLIRLSDRLAYMSEGSRPWRFEAAWLQSDQCEKVVADSWFMSGGRVRDSGLSVHFDMCQ
ncbi:UNVERIFIED_CONTAM: hypothetical protein Slati_1369000 [Sesamum latifolium]|uniref:Uncharacterized protein n=1 Tax=Sesamum latifolium TaxID=2727402 RepID=A0AAW2XJ33_9LAMI